MIFEGSAVALATPFTDTGINIRTLEELVRFQLDGGSDALVINGTTGEPATTTSNEKHQILECVVRIVDGRIPVIAGVGGNNTLEAAEEAKVAKAIGADAVLAVTPYYNRCSPDGLIRHFETIADIGQLPMIIYNVPSRTTMNITPEIFLRMSRHPLIVAIKEASGNISQITEIARIAGDQSSIYSGNDDTIIPLMAIGADGVISVLANIMPRYVHDMVMAYKSDNTDLARRMQLEVNGLVHALFSDVSPIPVKTALKIMGYDMGEPRLPLTRLSADKERALFEQMALFGLLSEEATL